MERFNRVGAMLGATLLLLAMVGRMGWVDWAHIAVAGGALCAIILFITVAGLVFIGIPVAVMVAIIAGADRVIRACARPRRT